MPKRTDISKVVLLIVFGSLFLSAQVQVPKIPSPNTFHDDADGIAISGLVFDADTGKPYDDTSLGLEVTPVDWKNISSACEDGGSARKTHLVSVRTDEKGQFSAHLEPGNYKIIFQLPGDRKFGCESVTSRTESWCQRKPNYRFVLQTSERFQGVVGTVQAAQPCAQGVRAVCESLLLPYVLRSTRVLLRNEDRTPIRNATLVASRVVMGPELPDGSKPKTLDVAEDGTVDFTPVFKEFRGAVDLVIQEKELSRLLRIGLSGDGNAAPQVVRVMQWKCPYKTGALWAAEITPVQN